jgi:DNA mismatch repair protein MLH3
LAKCSFPFQCAHGRPSIVALGGLGNAGAGEGQSSRLGTVQDDVEGGFDFVKAFDKWQTNAGEEFIRDDCPE